MLRIENDYQGANSTSSKSRALEAHLRRGLDVQVQGQQRRACQHMQWAVWE